MCEIRCETENQTSATRKWEKNQKKKQHDEWSSDVRAAQKDVCKLKKLANRRKHTQHFSYFTGKLFARTKTIHSKKEVISRQTVGLAWGRNDDEEEIITSISVLFFFWFELLHFGQLFDTVRVQLQRKVEDKNSQIIFHQQQFIIVNRNVQDIRDSFCDGKNKEKQNKTTKKWSRKWRTQMNAFPVKKWLIVDVHQQINTFHLFNNSVFLFCFFWVLFVIKSIGYRFSWIVTLVIFLLLLFGRTANDHLLRVSAKSIFRSILRFVCIFRLIFGWCANICLCKSFITVARTEENQ